MFKSIKWNTRFWFVAYTLIVSVIGQILVSYVVTGKIVFEFNTLIVVSIGVLCLIAYIIGTILAKYTTYPLKRIEKAMSNVIEGKVGNIKSVSQYSKSKEISEFTGIFNDMMQVIRKNNFDLNGQQSKTEIILEHMDDGIIAFSVSRQVIHINKIAMDLLGISENEDTFERIMKSIRLKVEFDKIMYLPNYKTFEEKMSIKDNTLNLVFVPFHSSKLIPMGIIMIIKNITESVKLDKMRKEFVANVSHELKTPLTSIKGYSETILDEELSYQDILKFTKVINDEANRMDRLVADLLQLSRFDYQKTSFNKTRFNLDDLAKFTTEKMSYAAHQKNHKLGCVVNMVPPPVFADKDAIEQVIINVLSNSIKYTPDGGKITLYVGSVGGNAYIKVSDNGMGIPDKDLNRIFERFYRVDKARSRSMGGTGLGLSIVKEIVEGNDGTIEIKSKVGVGTDIIITLPIKP